MSALSAIVKDIAASYGDIHAQARVAQVSPKEVAAALAKAKPDTAEFLVLSLLAQYHPAKDEPVAE